MSKKLAAEWLNAIDSILFVRGRIFRASGPRTQFLALWWLEMDRRAGR